VPSGRPRFSQLFGGRGLGALLLIVAATAGCHRRDSTAADQVLASRAAGSPGAPGIQGPVRCEELGLVPCQRQVAHVVVPIAGASISLVYSSDRVAGRKVDAATESKSIGLGGWSLSVLRSLDTSTNMLTTSEDRVRHVTPKRVELGTGVFAVADPDGQRIDIFDSRGREVAIHDARTATRWLAFVWDAHGLNQVVDRAGTALTIVRDAEGSPVGLESPRGAKTQLRTAGGWLTEIRSGRASTSMTTDAGGLLTQWIDVNGGSTRFEYDAVGRLTTVTADSGARTTLHRSESATDASVTVTNPSGARTVDSVHLNPDGSAQFVHTAPPGVTTTVQQSSTHSAVTLPDGRKLDLNLAPDRQWAMDMPVIASMSVTTPGSATPLASISEKRSGARMPDKSQAWGEALTVNGRTWHEDFDPAKRVLLEDDPAGRQSVTGFDETGRVITRTIAGGSTSSYLYDSSGRVAQTRLGSGAGSRVWKYAYSKSGDLTVIDPLGHSTAAHFTVMGALDRLSDPTSRAVTISRDPLSRVVRFTGAGQGVYHIVRRPDGQVTAVTAPAGDGAPEYLLYGYDAMGRLTGISSPDMKAVLQQDTADRIASIDYGSGPWTFGFDAAGRIAQAAGNGVTLSQVADGAGHVTRRIQGPFDIRITRTSDALGRRTSESLGNAAAVDYEYDAGSLLTRAGDLAITRDAQTGHVRSERLGVLTRSWTYDPFGAPASQTVTDDKGRVLVDLRWQRDALGRIVQQSLQSMGKPSRIEHYTYDARGRLESWTLGGSSTHYAYDAAGNRTRVTQPDGSTEAAEYNPRNELVRFGGSKFSYNGAGQLTKREATAGTTTYRYDLSGALLWVGRPDMTRIDYAVDSAGRRLASLRAGKLRYGIVYSDGLHPGAELGADGAVTTRYVYTDGQSPAYVTRNHVDYLEIADGASSPCVIVDAATGETVDVILRDPFGRVVSETSPGFQLVGFAGGLLDPDTGLIRFGARDYDPQSAQWTAPDPLSIFGGSPNLYGYVGADPVNRIDPTGQTTTYQVGGSGTLGFGAGVTAGGGVVISDTGTAPYVSGGGVLGAEAGLSVGGSFSHTPGSTPSSPSDANGVGVGVDFGVGPGSFGFDVGTDGSLGGHVNVGPTLGVSGSLTGTHVFGPGTPTQSASDDKDINDQYNCGGMDAGTCDPNPNDPNIGSPDDLQSPSATCGAGSSGTCNDTSDTGDPHLRTLGNVLYDFMAVGEFVGLQSDAGDLTVQFRQAPLGKSRSISVIAAAAFNVLGDRILVNPTADGELAVSVNGSPPLDGDSTVVLPHGAHLAQTPTQLRLSLPDSSVLAVKVNPYGLDFLASIPGSRAAKLHGLLGPASGSGGAVRAVLSRAGKSFTQQELADFSNRYRQLGDSWRLAQQDSLFHYGAGETTATFTDKTFPDRPPEISPTQRSAAESLCAALKLPPDSGAACVLDVAMTGDAGFAASTAALSDASATVPGPPQAASPGSGSAPVAANPIYPGNQVHGHLAVNAAMDYQMDVVEGAVGYFAAQPGCDNTQSLRWSISSEDGTAANDQWVCSDIGRFIFPKAGRYRLHVYSFRGGTGDFAVTWKTSRPDKHLSLAVGADAVGTLDLPGAEDIYQLDAAAGTTAYFAAAPGCDPALTLRWRIEGENGGPVSGDSGLCGDLGRIVFPKTGRYILRVYSYGGGTGAYRAKWSASRPDKELSLKAGDPMSGDIDLPGALDDYSMLVKAGDVGFLRAAPDCKSGSGIRWSISNERELSRDSDICADLGRVAFADPQTYRVHIYSYHGATGAYRAQWLVSRPDRHLSMNVGDSPVGNIDRPGAIDDYSLEAKAGETDIFKAAPDCKPAQGIRWTIQTAVSKDSLGDADICADLGKIVFTKAGHYILRVYSYNGGAGSYHVSRARP
jgi:RHS repeat-associated protein